MNTRITIRQVAFLFGDTAPVLCLLLIVGAGAALLEALA